MSIGCRNIIIVDMAPQVVRVLYIGSSYKSINSSLVKPSALNMAAISNCGDASSLYLRGEYAYVDNGFSTLRIR